MQDYMVSDAIDQINFQYPAERKIILVLPISRATERSEQHISAVAFGYPAFEVPIGEVLTKTVISYFSKLSGQPVLVVDSVPDKEYQNDIIIEPIISEYRFWRNDTAFKLQIQAEVTLDIVEHGKQSVGIAGRYNSGRINGNGFQMATGPGMEDKILEALIYALTIDLEQVGKKVPVKMTLSHD